LSIGLIIIIPQNLPFYQSFLTVIVAGISAGAVMSLSQYKSMIYSYLLILILPFTYIVYNQNSEVHTFIAILLIIFLITLLLFARRYNKNITDVIISQILIAKTEKELRLSERNFASIFKEVPIGIFTYNRDLVIQEVNQAFASHLKVSIDKLIKLDMHELKDNYFYQALNATIDGKKGFYEGIYHNDFSNQDIWISIKTVPMYDINNNIKGGLGITEDITERILSERKIRHQAFYDDLTGLANRLTLNTSLEQHIYTLQNTDIFSSILFMDIDNFKTINDSLGHHIGDELLRVFAKRLSSIVSKDDVVARLGGDEFVILLSNLGDKQLLANHRSNQMAKEVHNIIKNPISVEEHILHITLSIGINIIDAKNKDINNIIKNADIAMYKAKELGRNTTCFFEKNMSNDIENQLILNNELRSAIKNEEFELYYQPIAQTNDLKIVSCEALIRWNHPTKGVVYPDSFIPYAEDSGLIFQIGNWVIERACIDYKDLNNYVDNIAINISGKQFNRDDFLDDILSITEKHNINPSALKLELTESVIIDNFSSTLNKMVFLKSYGFALSMDDFGTGYTSLSYIKNLPFNFLKIDRSFIQNILVNEDDASLVKTILNISNQFHFKVIAEGVETEEHIKVLNSLECDYIQGYVLSKPITKSAFQEFVKKHNKPILEKEK
jgi:diguanylate cyclase (GGDEF)-like protein/PAS domain S-box-containing protein